jgi:hypothetical protein
MEECAAYLTFDIFDDVPHIKTESGDENGSIGFDKEFPETN